MLLVKFSRRSIINISLPLKKDKRMFKYHSAEEPQSAAMKWYLRKALAQCPQLLSAVVWLIKKIPRHSGREVRGDLT